MSTNICINPLPEIDEHGTFSQPMKEVGPEQPESETPLTSLTLDVPGSPSSSDGLEAQQPIRSRTTSFSVSEDKGIRDLQIKPTVSEVAEFTADRPFLFAVRHNLSGIILFVGRVSTISPKHSRQSAHQMKVPSNSPSAYLLSPKFLRKMSNVFPRRDSWSN